MAAQQRLGRPGPRTFQQGSPKGARATGAAVSIEDQVRYAYFTPLDSSSDAANPLPPRHAADNVQASRTAQFGSPTDRLPQSAMPAPIAQRLPSDHPALAVQWKSGGFSGMQKSKSAGALRAAPEHPGMTQMRKHYKPMTKKDRKHTTFLPFAWRKTAPMSLAAASPEQQQIHHSRYSQSAVSGALRSAGTAALEPLEEDKMRLDAMQALLGRAKYRMQMEGVSLAQQELVLSELPDVMHASMSADRENIPVEEDLGE